MAACLYHNEICSTNKFNRLWKSTTLTWNLVAEHLVKAWSQTSLVTGPAKDWPWSPSKEHNIPNQNKSKYQILNVPPQILYGEVTKMSNGIEIQTPSFQELEISQGNSYSLSEIRQPKQQQPRLVWLFVDTICLGAVGLAILCFKLAVPPYRRGFYCDDDSINKPYKDSTVPSSVLYSVGYALAFLVAAVTEWYNYRHKKRSGMESCDEVYFKLGPVKLNSLLIQLLRLYLSFAFGGLITVFVTDVGKYTVGRLRPHFLSICKAPTSIFINCSHNYILDDVCTGDPDLLRAGRLSFPSGHASFSGTSKKQISST